VRAGRSRGRGLSVSRGRQKIMNARDKRRQEDIANAMRLKEELMEAKNVNESK